MYTFVTNLVSGKLQRSFKGISFLNGILVLFLMFSFIQVSNAQWIAPYVQPSGGLIIDGDLTANVSTPNTGDWVPGPGGTGGSVFTSLGAPLFSTAYLLNDPYNVNNDDVFQASALNDDPNVWRWTASSAPSKNEINRGMVYIGQDASGNFWIAMGADRLSTNGTAYIDFELLQNTMVKNANGTFTSAGPHGGRTLNDLLITVNYNNGGGTSEIIFNRWSSDGAGGYIYKPFAIDTNHAYAVTNATSVAVPFGAFGSTTYSTFQFVEAAVDLTNVITVATNNPCASLNVKTIFIKTKASTSTTAELKDLIDPIQTSFNLGSVTIDPIGPVCVNGSAITLSGSPAGGTFSGPGVSGNTFNPAIAGAGVHKIYYSKLLGNGCTKSDSTTVTVNALSVGGAVAGGTSVCSGSNSGTLTLSGYTGTILRWEFSTDGGTNYTPISNTSTTQTFSNLTTTTKYRAVVQNGVCAPANSSPATVTVSPASVGGSVLSSRSVCYGNNSGTLTLSGQVGNVIRWEYSVNGNSWTSISNTTTSQSYSNLTQQTSYRAVVQSGACASANSSPATISIDPVSQGGSLAGSSHVCAVSNSGTITLSGQSGTIIRWEKSTNDGASWTNISNTTTSLTYTNLSVTTIFRAVVQSGSCDPAYSTTVTITVDPASDGGSIQGPAMICNYTTTGELTVSGYTGNIIRWEYSTDNITWITIANTTNTLALGSLSAGAYHYRVLVQSGSCPEQYSSSFQVTVMNCGSTSSHCTYTQGFYGNVGGRGCSGGDTSGNTLETTLDKLNKAFDFYGSNRVIFGRIDIGGVPADDRAFTLFRDDINNQSIFKMLPGGGTSMLLGIMPGGSAFGSTYEGATYSNQSTWSAVPLVASGPNKGRIKNSLLAQTMTLFFNLNNGTNLAALPLHDTLYVSDFDCLTGDPVPGAGILTFGLPHDVLVYIVNNPTEYTKDVGGLYKLANDILGGVATPGLNPSQVIDAVDKINNAFDECRTLVGSFDVPITNPTLSSVPYADDDESRVSISADQALFVKSFPNPYTEKVSFTLKSKQTGHGTLEIYNIMGQKVTTLFDGMITAGAFKMINYEIPKSQRGVLTYVFRMGASKVSGKMVNMSR